MSIVLNNTLYTRYQKVINLSVASCLILFFLDRVARALKSNYTRWYSLAPGGVPHNLLGWIVNWLLWPLGDSDMTSIRPYLYPAQTKQYGKATTQKNLREPLPWREPYAARPFVEPDFSVPQRQESQPVPGHLKEAQSHILETFRAEQPNSLRIATSGQEKHGPALFLAESLPLPSWARSTKGEIAHIHIDAEGSGHCSLTPADAMEVVEKGWGQRHRLSKFIHVGYVMVYAPRDEKELEVMRKIFRAAIDAFVPNENTRASK